MQIAGTIRPCWPDAARYNADSGAQIIDINMGCPAKKVCNVYAGSALLQDEPLVARILSAVVAAVDVPVTLKIRTGWNRDNRNGERVATIAQDSGIAALAVHGRTRADLYEGEAEYETIAAIKQAVSIPVLANGDVDTPQKARQVLGCCARFADRRAGRLDFPQRTTCNRPITGAPRRRVYAPFSCHPKHWRRSTANWVFALRASIQLAPRT